MGTRQNVIDLLRAAFRSHANKNPATSSDPIASLASFSDALDVFQSLIQSAATFSAADVIFDARLLICADFVSANANPVFISALCSIIRSENVPPLPVALALQDGSRVRIENLHAKPQYNGRNGVICGAFHHSSGRWPVNVDTSDLGFVADGLLLIRSANLTLLPSVSDSAPPGRSVPSPPAPPLTAKQQAQIMAHAFGSHVLPLVRKAQSHGAGAHHHSLSALFAAIFGVVTRN